MSEESLPNPQERHLKERAFKEFKRFIVIFLYLWVVFGLLSIHKSLVLSQDHLDTQEKRQRPKTTIITNLICKLLTFAQREAQV
jgi:hypothetical protein